MDEYDDIHLECENPEVVKACAKGIRRNDYKRHPWKKGATHFHAKMQDSNFDNKVRSISKLFPDDVIYVQYISITFLQTLKVIYRNGYDEQLDIVAIFQLRIPLPVNNEADFRAIIDKAFAFFRRLDIREKDQNDKLFLIRFNDECTYRFEYKGVEGNIYKIKGTRIKNDIYFKVLENLDGIYNSEISDLTPDAPRPTLLN